MSHRCPDCGVSMRQAKPHTALQHERVRLRTEESKGGVLGSLGAKRSVDVLAYVCPECGLVRWYADLEGA
ncbi:hypothetical protein ACNS7O_01870 [Haloferacaceae archaeon DSL9]